MTEEMINTLKINIIKHKNFIKSFFVTNNILDLYLY